MNKRLLNKTQKKRLRWIEVSQDGLLDGLNRQCQLAEPRIVFNKGAKVFVYGRPEKHGKTVIVPIRVRLKSGAIQKCWIEEKALKAEGLRALLEKLGLKSRLS